MLSKMARNERRKLIASLLNSLASGTILAAVISPLIGFGFGTVQFGIDLLNMVGLSGFGVSVAIVIHLIALDILKTLED